MSKASRRRGPSKRILVGRIVRPYGVKGDVYVHPFSDNPQRFSVGSRFQLADGRVLEVERSSKHPSKNLYRLHLSGVDSRNAAEDMVGENLYVSEEDLPELDEGEFYIYQLIGLEVFSLDGEHIGRVRELLETGGVDVLVISRYGRRDVLIPFAREYVKEVNLEKGVIVVDISQMEGLM